MASDTLTQYEYTPLEDPGSQIRLLEVFRDSKESNCRFRCRLTTWHVDSAPAYHAISYTWGPEHPRERIRLDEASIHIRKNCADALHQLLYFGSSSYYWIDALCIDQKSVHEKNHQVARMGQVYSKAAHVLVCLGDYDDDAEYAFGIISQLWEYYFPPTCERLAGKSIERLSLRGFYSSPEIDPARFALSLEALTQRSYFNRVWIVQELILAQSVSMYCGHFQLPIQYPYTDLILRAAAAYKVQTRDTLAKAAAPMKLDLKWVRWVQEKNQKDRRVLHLLEQKWEFSEQGEKSTLGAALEHFHLFSAKTKEITYMVRWL